MIALYCTGDGARLPFECEEIADSDPQFIIGPPGEPTARNVTNYVTDLVVGFVPAGTPRVALYLGPRPNPWFLAGAMQGLIQQRVGEVLIFVSSPSTGRYEQINPCPESFVGPVNPDYAPAWQRERWLQLHEDAGVVPPSLRPRSGVQYGCSDPSCGVCYEPDPNPEDRPDHQEKEIDSIASMVSEEIAEILGDEPPLNRHSVVEFLQSIHSRLVRAATRADHQKKEMDSIASMVSEEIAEILSDEAPLNRHSVVEFLQAIHSNLIVALRR
jgi:hypothetical protein